jgi:hypothetical protein
MAKIGILSLLVCVLAACSQEQRPQAVASNDQPVDSYAAAAPSSPDSPPGDPYAAAAPFFPDGAPATQETSKVAEPTKPSRKYDVALDCVGRDNHIDGTLVASYRVNSVNKTWWICYDTGSCTDPRPAEVITPDVIIFERNEFKTTGWQRKRFVDPNWPQTDGHLGSGDTRIDATRSMGCQYVGQQGGEMMQ